MCVYICKCAWTYVCVCEYMCRLCWGEEEGSGSGFSVVVASMIYVLLCIRYKISVVSIYFTVKGHEEEEEGGGREDCCGHHVTNISQVL